MPASECAFQDKRYSKSEARKGATMNRSGFFSKIVTGELPEPPITKLLGWRFVDFDEARQVMKVEMQARPEFLNPAGVIHGGILAAMLDETLAPTLAATLGAGEFAPTLELKVNFIAPAKVGRILGTGRIVSRGRSICFLEGQLHDDAANLLATATGTSKIGRSR
ncbi:PaaI family thioesterase [Bradyrhizobium sp. CB82]|uniref:PaaI family thioesterase n=1 Tax=Bradyrhizobium sp. CB82 TaxID=3039159 RepID=UPI0024B04C46|nr:PaaI family thioesterase [Bradyrhizobium sp. CB82]WFU41514.1 PaaI family thioesterase [Bradyrhizobium sp. CB82]